MAGSLRLRRATGSGPRAPDAVVSGFAATGAVGTMVPERVVVIDADSGEVMVRFMAEDSRLSNRLLEVAQGGACATLPCQSTGTRPGDQDRDQANMTDRADALAALSLAVEQYGRIRDECTHCCRCSRASASLNAAVYVGRMAGATWAALAAVVGVSYQRVQQRARAAEVIGPGAVDALAAGTPEEVELR